LSHVHPSKSTKEFDLLRHQKHLYTFNAETNARNIDAQSEPAANIKVVKDFLQGNKKKTGPFSIEAETNQSDLCTPAAISSSALLASRSNQGCFEGVSTQDDDEKRDLISRVRDSDVSNLWCLAAIISSTAAAIQYRDFLPHNRGFSQRRHTTANISGAFVKGLTAFPESESNFNSFLQDSDFLTKPAQLGLTCAQSIDSLGGHHELPIMPVSV